LQSPERAVESGAAFGAAWVRAGGPRVADARVNLRIAFPEMSEEKRERILLESFRNLGRCLGEFAFLSRLTDEEAKGRVRIEGLELYEAARARKEGGGAVALTAHFGNWELFGIAMGAYGYPLTIVHRERENPLLDDIVMGQRGAGAAENVARGNAARAALRALRDGRFLAMPYDQSCKPSEGVFVPFFGRLAIARVAPARIAMKTGVPVIPCFLHREPDGFHHVCKIRPALEMVEDPTDPAAALVENVRRMTRSIEDEIRRAPEQWSWIHRRWRVQPPGEPRPGYA
jgi:KDO2-lipid IV(A) lauroyltransferase